MTTPATTGFPAEEKCANCAFWRRHHLGVTLKCPVSEPPFTTFESCVPCQRCGGWTQNEDGHRVECPMRKMSLNESDRVMLLVWEQWAQKEGNEGAAQMFRRAADLRRAVAAYRNAHDAASAGPHASIGPRQKLSRDYWDAYGALMGAADA